MNFQIAMKSVFVIYLLCLFPFCRAEAANHFRDVPADHWSYDVLQELHSRGIVLGFGDNSYRGDRNMTRYEMAQITARAMACATDKRDKDLIDRLCAEFQEELKDLGVRVKELEKNVDAVKWTGRANYLFTSDQTEGRRTREKSIFSFRIEPTAKINKHWKVNGRLDMSLNINRNSAGTVQMNRVWAEGKYGNTVIRLGKVPLSTNENGIVLESSFTGFTVQTGKSWKVLLLGGRLNMSKTGAYRVGMGYSRELRAMGMTKEAAEVRAMARDPATIFGVNLQYKTNKKIFGGLGYYHLSSKAYNFIADMENESKAGVNIGSVNLGYRFSPKCVLTGAYAKAYYSKDPDMIEGFGNMQDYSWEVELSYGNYRKASKKGEWKAYLAYSNYGYISSVIPASSNIDDMYDDDMGIANWGERGWEIGGSWALEKNVGLVASYFWGRSITSHRHMKSVLARLEMFF